LHGITENISAHSTQPKNFLIFWLCPKGSFFNWLNTNIFWHAIQFQPRCTNSQHGWPLCITELPWDMHNQYTIVIWGCQISPTLITELQDSKTKHVATKFWVSTYSRIKSFPYNTHYQTTIWYFWPYIETVL